MISFGINADLFVDPSGCYSFVQERNIVSKMSIRKNIGCQILIKIASHKKKKKKENYIVVANVFNQ